MTTYAALTDGTTTITFASPGTLGWYRIETGWTPKVAGLRQNQLGGRGPYEDVTEEIPVSIGGSTAAHMYANLSALQALLQQSNSWYRGEAASAVLFKYSPEGATVSTTASPLQAAIWGAEFDAGQLTSIPQSGSAVWATGGNIRVNRRGMWIHSSASGSASGSTGQVITIPVASTSYPSPTRVQFTNYGTGIESGGTFAYQNGFVILTSSSTNIVSVEAERMTGSGGFTAISAASAQFTSGGSVLKFVAAGSTSSYTSAAASFAVPSGCSLAAVFFEMRLLSLDNPAVNINISGEVTASGPTIPIDGSYASDTPTWYYGGTLPVRGSAASLSITAKAITTTESYFDRVIVVNLSSPDTQIIRIPRTSYTAASGVSVDINPQEITYPWPDVSGSSAALGNKAFTATGDTYLTTKSGSVYALALLSSGSPGSAWIYNQNVTNTWTVTRQTAYPIPA